jgi:hypothetical protein
MPRFQHSLALLFVLPVLIVAATAAQAQITFVADLGSNAADGSTTGFLTMTTTANVPAGGSVIVVAADVNVGQTGPAFAQCTDSASHAYSTDVSVFLIGTALTTICATHQIASQFSTGGTIRVTWTSSAGGQNVRVRAFAVTGLASPSFDRTAEAIGSSFSPNSGTAATTSVANELLVGAIFDETDHAASDGVGNVILTPGTNGTANNCATSGTPTYTASSGVGTTNPGALFGMQCIVSATGAYQAAGMLSILTLRPVPESAGPLWQAGLATYKGAPPPCSGPSITCPGNIQQYTDSGKFTATVNPGTPTTTGGCGNVTIQGVRSDGKALTDPYPVGMTQITWTATDSKGNTANCVQTINVLVPSHFGPGPTGPRRRPPSP